MSAEYPLKQPESLSGLIERVTFYNEENGFVVLRIKARGHRDLVTLVGSVPSVSAGDWVPAQGQWIQDREFGLQFRGHGHLLALQNEYNINPGSAGTQ